MEDKIISTEELAALLGKKPKTLYNWMNKGVPMPPSYRIPGVRGSRFLMSEVMAWIKKFAVPQAGAPAAPTEAPRRGRPRSAHNVAEVKS
ncbi:helix-turn-helix transcriptional regulator [Mariprofundus ferrooxydans]|uniref:helix-turn-helix transcriptional regulator n=1 Tax=Mariprofundus ferrooxydans TaxID=314344 RepID=UPI00142F69DA|nr:helix-turn-helix domain-containing protein [Mariprofundus ferrooxydans]